jgi:hypothetical protein
MGLSDVKTLVEWKLYVCFLSAFSTSCRPRPNPGVLAGGTGDASRNILRLAAALIEQALRCLLPALSEHSTVG